MNCSQISRFCLSNLLLKQHCGSLKFFSREHQYLLGRSCYFVVDTTRECHFSHVSCSRWTLEVAPGSNNHMNSLLLRNFTCYSESLALSSSLTFSRSLSNFPQGSREKPYQDRETTSKSTKVPAEPAKEETGEALESAKKLTLYQRFKKTYKEHGKILVAVHLLTSAVWFGSFYGIARGGIDIVSYMETWNFSERIISPFRSGGLGDVAVAYLMYKLATPARYTVTIAGTNLAIRYLRKEGKMPQVPQEDTIRSLYKESKEDLKRRSSIHLRKLKRKQKMKARIVHHSKEKH